MSFLKGKKTYIAAAGGVLTAIGGYLTGAMDLAQAITLAWQSIAAATLRKAIS